METHLPLKLKVHKKHYEKRKVHAETPTCGRTQPREDNINNQHKTALTLISKCAHANIIY